ncbi:MAG: LysM peptidoglycan-binding domain-containing protein, partial [Burkholderiales bacterium]
MSALLCGCAATGVPAPIIDRSPAPVVASRTEPKAAPTAQTPAPKPTTTLPAPKAPSGAVVAAKPVDKPAMKSVAAPRPVEQPIISPYREGDWRPEYYVVQKGDTLYSIALDFGQDYRDLATWNSLADPAYIQVGQQLRLFPRGGATDTFAPEPAELPPASLAAQEPAAAPVKTIPTFSEPKARKLPYSEQNLAGLLNQAVAAKPAPVVTVAAPAAVPQKREHRPQPKP